jgi:hypothetical protein
MFRKLIATIVCLTSLTLASLADGQPSDDYGWVISLGGSGSTATIDDHSTAIGADISVGYTGKLLLPLEAGLRQGFSYDNSAVFSTKAYADFTLFSFANKAFDVFVGGNVGAVYGDTQLGWVAAPEGGLRWWVKEDVSVLLRAEAPFQLNNDAGFTDNVRYFLGFQVRFR